MSNFNIKMFKLTSAQNLKHRNYPPPHSLCFSMLDFPAHGL